MAGPEAAEREAQPLSGSSSPASRHRDDTMRSALGGKRAAAAAEAAPHWGPGGRVMAACGYLLLLGCIVANLPLVLVHLNEWRATPEESNQRYSGPISMLERRNDHLIKVHGDHSKKMLPFRKAKQQENSQMSLIRRRRYYSVVRNNEGISDEEQERERKEYYLPVPPSRLSPYKYQDVTYHSEQQVTRARVKDVIIHQTAVGVPSQIYQDLKDERIKQVNKHHNTSQEHEQDHKKEQRSSEHDDYWIVGQRRFRIIVLSNILAAFSSKVCCYKSEPIFQDKDLSVQLSHVNDTRGGNFSMEGAYAILPADATTIF
ncbi:uncharacterized protein LOC144610593 [Rhinoraja longicauda]